MTSGIGGAGSGGVGGPRGPDGPRGPGGAGGIDEPGEALATPIDTGGARGAEAGSSASIDRLSADLEAGRITPDEALAQLISEAVPGGLPPNEIAELKSTLSDLLASDPYLAALAARLGARPEGG